MILIIANARIKGGLSGGDNIYLHLAEHSDAEIWELMGVDFKPFFFCYVLKIMLGCRMALCCKKKYEFVYSASDFWMDSLPALILKAKGNKWVAGFYMFAPKKNRIYYYTQKPIKWLIDKFADAVCVTNHTMFDFKKPTVAVHGGVDLADCYPDISTPKIYDAVFVGRLHYTKGIIDLISIWDLVLERIPNATLAVIGDGDSEAELFKGWAKHTKGVTNFGFLDSERFDIYRKSKMVLYPTPYKYSHFSMGPIEAMACGCPLISYDLPEMGVEGLKHKGGCFLVKTRGGFSEAIIETIRNYNSLNYLIDSAIEYAKTWDWSKRAPLILKQIRSVI